MKRTSNHINRNTPSVLNHIRNLPRNNAVTPEVLVNQIWMQDEEMGGVKIIELNSSSNSPKESPVNHFSHAWSFVNNDRFEEADYIINNEARRRRRMNYDESAFAQAFTHDYFDNHMETERNGFLDTYDMKDDESVDHQVNCLTIMSNPNINTDSSSDNDIFESIEVIEIDNTEEQKYWDHVYNEQVAACDLNTQPEKRTIWIYSYKNQRILSENDFELVNIPSKDTSSSSFSISDEEQKTNKSTNVHRLGSPIPATYIPKLDLSLVQTLSTVTELSEPNRQHSNEASMEKLTFKPKNNWLTDRNYKLQKQNCNVINWMALSPRERRRRSINTNADTRSIDNFRMNETEVTPAEGMPQTEQINIKSEEIALSTVEVQVDIHVNESEIAKEVTTQDKWVEPMSEIKKITDTFPIKISFDDEVGEIDNEKIKEFDYSNKPYIQLEIKPDRTIITDPIQNLDSNNWISDIEISETETKTYKYDKLAPEANETDDNEFDTASRRLWKKNLQLMKPPEWTQYLPLADSPLSLHLSLSLSSIDNKKSWYKRIIKFFKCCK